MPPILLELIDPPTQNVRRVAPSPGADAQLSASIGAIGVLQPVLVVAAGNRYQLIDGARRVHQAREQGLTEIPAEIAPPAADGWATAAAAASNLVRAPMEPLDQWRVIAGLQAQGYTLPGACAALGLDERTGRQLDRLSKLHPEVMKQLERGDWPQNHQMAIIAGAKPADQARTVKEHRVAAGPDKGRVQWWAVVRALENTQFALRDAIFDVSQSKVSFEEDLFAEPGSADAIYTTDGKGFMAAQQTALEARIAKPPKGVVYAAGVDDSYGRPRTPKGFRQLYGTDWRKAKRGQHVHFVMSEYGAVTAVVFEAPTAAEPPAGAADLQDENADAEDGGHSATASVPAPAVAPAGISKIGLDMIAQAKTETLQTHLREMRPGELSPETALTGLLLLLSAPNVSVNGVSKAHLMAFHSKLVSPFGTLRLVDEAQLVELTAELLALCLRVTRPDDQNKNHRVDAGPVAEWLGCATNAGRGLPRFDTEAFLATVQVGVLQQLAQRLGLKPAKKAADLRRQLTGAAPDWRPDQSAFAAMGPEAAALERSLADIDADEADDEQEEAA